MQLIDKLRREFTDHKQFWILFLLLILLIFIIYKDYGVSWDEVYSIRLGDHALNYYLTLGKDKSLFSLFSRANDPVSDPTLLTRGPAIEIVRSIIMRGFNSKDIDTYHLILSLFFIPAFYFVYKTILIITKNKTVSICAFIFLFLFPRFFGDIFNNQKDISLLLMTSIFLYKSIRMFIEKNNWHRRDFVFLGLIVGVGMSLRIIFIYLPAIFLFFYFIYDFENRDQDKRTKFLQYMVFLVSVSLLVFYVLSPVMHKISILQIVQMFKNAYKFPGAGPVLFDRVYTKSSELPWYYLPKYIFITTPLITLFFLLIVNPYFLKNKENKKHELINLYLWTVFCLPILIAILARPVMFDAWRHFLFLTVPLVLLSSIGFSKLYLSTNKSIKLIAIFLFLANIVLTGREMILLHPYEYIYFNSIVGGLKGANGLYETDYWGKSMKEGLRWIYQNRDKLRWADGKVHISSCIPHLTVSYLNDKIIQDAKDFDIYMCITRWYGDKMFKGHIIHVVEREGVPLDIIKKISNR